VPQAAASDHWLWDYAARAHAAV